MKKILFFMLLFTGLHVSAQKSLFKWDGEMCQYEGTYDKKVISENQLKSCYQLTYAYNFGIEHTPVVFHPKDIAKLSMDSLDEEYHCKVNLLNSLELPKSAYWEELRKSIATELEQTYQVSRISYMGYKDPTYLKEWHKEDTCLSRHAKALIAGGDSLVNDWHDLTSEMVKQNCCPDVVWKEYNDQLDSEDRDLWAKVNIMGFGWWNCAIGHIERSENKFDTDRRLKEFMKLFSKTKVKCEEP
jgi:hypothetical protein